MNFRRFKQVCQYGWKDADTISKIEGVKKSKISIFQDILFCYFKYNVWSNQYKKEKLYALDGEKRKEICLKYQEKNTKRDQWVKEFFNNYKFLNKWSSFKYEKSATLQDKRRAAYKKRYGLGDNCFVGYDVIFHRHHYTDGKIVTGINCLIAEHTNIDYTGGFTIGNNVKISESVKILTHNHDLDYSQRDKLRHGVIRTPLFIRDNVAIGARALIMPGVNEIGRGAMVSAGAVVKRQVPPYAIVIGNPARVVGFRYPPAIIAEFEEENYPEEERIPIEVLEDNYKKYYLSKLAEIKAFLG